MQYRLDRGSGGDPHPRSSALPSVEPKWPTGSPPSKTERGHIIKLGYVLQMIFFLLTAEKGHFFTSQFISPFTQTSVASDIHLFLFMAQGT